MHNNEIIDLNVEETEAVSGGVAPLVVYGGFVLLGFGLAATADYLNGGFND